MHSKQSYLHWYHDRGSFSKRSQYSERCWNRLPSWAHACHAIGRKERGEQISTSVSLSPFSRPSRRGEKFPKSEEDENLLCLLRRRPDTKGSESCTHLLAFLKSAGKKGGGEILHDLFGLSLSVRSAPSRSSLFFSEEKINLRNKKENTCTYLQGNL